SPWQRMTQQPSRSGEPEVLRGAGELPAEAFRMIVDMTAHAFVVIAPSGTVLYAGGSIERILGWPAAEVAGRNMAEFLPPESLAVAIEAVAEIDAFDREGAGVPIIVQINRKEGPPAWVEVGA